MIYYEKDGITVRPSTPADVEYLKDKLRASDVEEVYASHHHSAEMALKLSLESTTCLTIDIKGKPTAMFGIQAETILGNRAIIWMLASNDLCKISKRFLKNCRKFIDIFLNDYPYLHNYVHNDNVVSIQWLKMIGATLGSPEPYGLNNELFRYFYFKKD